MSFRASFCTARWATSNHIWIQRNNRVHKREITTEEQLVKAISRDVKARMETVKISDSIPHRILCNNWRIQFGTS